MDLSIETIRIDRKSDAISKVKRQIGENDLQHMSEKLIKITKKWTKDRSIGIS